MSQLSYPARKLKGSIVQSKIKANSISKKFKVYGVTNIEGLTQTGKDQSEDTSNYLVVKENQFAYNPYRVNVGSLGLAPKGFQGIVSPAYVVFETKEDIIPEFLFYYLKSPLGLNLIKWYGDRGGVRSALRFNDLEEIDFPDITKDQQLKALKIMKRFEQKINIFLTEQKHCKELIQKLRQSILQEAVSGKLVPQDSNDEPSLELLKRIKVEIQSMIKDKKIRKNKPLPIIKEEEMPFQIPQSWIWIRLGEICFTVADGPHFSPKYVDKEQGILFLSSRNITTRNINLSTAKYISEEDHSEFCKRIKPKMGDILYTKGGTTGVAKVNDLDEEFSVWVHLAVLQIPNDKLSAEYIAMTLNSPHCYMQSQKYTHGVGNKDLGLTRMAKITLPLPPLNEQKRIVQKVAQLIKFCDDIKEQVKENQKNSELLMEAVLREAFQN